MNINLQIERLVLDGIDMSSHQRAVLRTTVEVELRRLLLANGFSPRSLQGNAISRLPAEEIRYRGNQHVPGLGREIAQAMYRGIGR